MWFGLTDFLSGIAHLAALQLTFTLSTPSEGTRQKQSFLALPSLHNSAMQQLTEKWMQPAFCHDSQWSWSVIQNLKFYKEKFTKKNLHCAQKNQQKTSTQQFFPQICFKVGSSSCIVYMVLQTWWLTAKLSADCRKGCKIFWRQMRKIIKKKNCTNFILVGDRMRLC